MSATYVIGVDVGTGSARAGLFDANGHRLATASYPIELWRPEPLFAEQSTADIWASIGKAIRDCLADAAVPAAEIAGISFDATCSLVLVDATGRSLPINRAGDTARDVVVWMDHRALAETEEINAGGYPVLQYVGGRLSPEMETPKLLWIKRNLPDIWERAVQCFDLADYLTWRATGSLSRSSCTVTCKWTYLSHENRWDISYFEAIGLADALPKIGSLIQPMGTPLGKLTPAAASKLGLTEACVVGQGIIDAHAGGLGLLGGVWHDGEGTPAQALETALALIGGTSNCHMAVSLEAKFVPGVWGPYYGAMVPGMWLAEGGQSTAGAAIDHVIYDHANAPELEVEARRRGVTVYELLNEEIRRLGADVSGPALTRHLHILPYFLGNRSPHADPHARGVYNGLTLDQSLENHALRYYAAVQAVAYGTRDIIAALNAAGFSINSLFVTGGGTKNPLWLQEHADITGATLLLPDESEAVLLGTAILAATAAGLHADLFSAMAAMSRTGSKIAPRPEWKAYHDQKFAVYQRMYQDQLGYREMMREG